MPNDAGAILSPATCQRHITKHPLMPPRNLRCSAHNKHGCYTRTTTTAKGSHHNYNYRNHNHNGHTSATTCQGDAGPAKEPGLLHAYQNSHTTGLQQGRCSARRAIIKPRQKTYRSTAAGETTAGTQADITLHRGAAAANRPALSSMAEAFGNPR